MSQTATQKHPAGLYTLFFTEMWERFSYYGMRALLVLYLTSAYEKSGFAYDRATALEIYGIFTGLVYLTPLLGGLMADKVLGQRKAIFIGGLLMAMGQFSLAASQFGDIAVRQFIFNFGLGLLIMGNGFFKPNISTIVGELYEKNDPRKDSAFTIFYMGINLGAFFSPLVCGTLGEQIGWFWGFLSAGIGLLVGMFWFHFRADSLGNSGFPPRRTIPAEGQLKLLGRDWTDIIAYTIANVAFVYGSLTLWEAIDESTETIIKYTLGIAGLLAFLFIVFTNTSGSDEWSRVVVIFVLCAFNIFFWAGFEQAGGTFNLFAAENTNRNLFGYEVAASAFQSINAILIFILAPLFSGLWIWLGRSGNNPNIPVKFSFGLIFLGLGFIVMSMASKSADGGTMVSPLWLVSVYLLHTVGELCLSPIGLSMISKLSPPKITALMMGLWFGSTALANYMAGVLENILEHNLPDMPLFNFLTLTSLVAGALLLMLSPWLKKMMKGVG